MQLLRVLWTLYRRSSGPSTHQPRIVAVAAGEERRQSKLQATFWRLFWRLYFRSSRTPLRAFRVVINQRDRHSRWIVYQHIERNRFVASSYYSVGKQFASEAMELVELNDAWNTVNRLRSPLPVGLDCWEDRASNSIDEACEKGDVWLQDLGDRAIAASQAGDEVPEDLGDETGCDTPIPEPIEQDEPYETLVAERLKDLCRMARAKDVHWRPIESTETGRECQILVIDGREDHLL